MAVIRRLRPWPCWLLVVACTNSPARPPASGSAPAPTAAAPAATTPPPTTPPPTTPPAAPAADSIGVATMQADGSIVMDLRATGPGMVGDARIVYGKDHKEYQNILTHLGGLKPGETKPVPPFP